MTASDKRAQKATSVTQATCNESERRLQGNFAQTVHDKSGDAGHFLSRRTVWKQSQACTHANRVMQRKAAQAEQRKGCVALNLLTLYSHGDGAAVVRQGAVGTAKGHVGVSYSHDGGNHVLVVRAQQDLLKLGDKGGKGGVYGRTTWA